MITPTQTLEQQLDQLANSKASQGGLLSATGQRKGSRWKIAFDRVEELGCQVRDLRLDRVKPAQDGDAVRVESERVCREIGYLLEPLALLEFDSEGATAIIRSQTPSREDGANAYYEIVNKADGLTLQRFAAKKGQPRKSVPFTITRQALERLLNDLV